jgi:diketogulonate reductase-like aldo/keto reductase
MIALFYASSPYPFVPRTMAIAAMPRLGMGTWHMGERARSRAAEVTALRAGLDLGLTLVDTAEMYGEGGAEEVVAEAIAGRREQVYLVSKVYPHHAGARDAVAACERSLARLRVERLDCYLLHWRGRIPLAETVSAFERLVADGKIARWGVSNFDVDDMEELFALPEGRRCAANQVLYHLGERAIEWRLLDWCRAHGVGVMAYSPLGQGDLLRDRKLVAIADGLGVPAATLATAFVLAREGVVAIPKAACAEHLPALRRALDLAIDDATRAALDRAFAPPRRATRLPML